MRQTFIFLHIVHALTQLRKKKIFNFILLIAFMFKSWLLAPADNYMFPQQIPHERPCTCKSYPSPKSTSFSMYFPVLFTSSLYALSRMFSLITVSIIRRWRTIMQMSIYYYVNLFVRIFTPLHYLYLWMLGKGPSTYQHQQYIEGREFRFRH